MRGKSGPTTIVALVLGLACAPGADALKWSQPIALNSHHTTLRGIACPAASQCTAVDMLGYEYTFAPKPADPATKSALIDPGLPNQDTVCSPLACTPNAIACPSSSECVEVDEDGIAVTFDPRSPSGRKLAYIDPGDNGGYSLNGIACPSASSCTAVDEIAAQLTFNPSKPHNVHDVQVDTRNGSVQLDAVACPSSSQCTAVDSQGYEVTFNPAANKAFLKGARIDPHGWLNSIACPSRTQCTAVDRHGYEVTFNPLQPHSNRVRIDTAGLNGIACPSTGMCVAADRHGRVVTGAPGGHWTVTPLKGAGRLQAVSCYSTSVCVVVDSAGHAYVGR